MPGEFYVENKAEKVDLADIKNLISQLQSAITQVQGDVTSIITSAGRQLSSMDFWSGTLEEAQINAAGVTVALPGVTINGIPAGATVLRAIAMFKFRMVENTNAAANTYGQYVYQGSYVYKITLDKGFELKGRVTHYTDEDVFKKSGYYYGGGNLDIKRNLYIDGSLYSVSNSKIMINALADLSKEGEIGLQ